MQTCAGGVGELQQGIELGLIVVDLGMEGLFVHNIHPFWFLGLSLSFNYIVAPHLVAIGRIHFKLIRPGTQAGIHGTSIVSSTTLALSARAAAPLPIPSDRLIIT